MYGGGTGKSGMSKLSTEAQRRLLAHDAAEDRRRRRPVGQDRLALALLGLCAFALLVWVLWQALFS